MIEKELTPAPGDALAQVGQIANRHARQNVIAQYLATRARGTRRAHAVALAAFADYLRALSDRLGVDLASGVADFAQIIAGWATPDTRKHAAPPPAAWAGVTWGVVQGYRDWLLREGVAIGTVNLRLSVVKTYCKLAAQAGVISPDELRLITTVAGFSRKDGKRIDERRPVTRRGPKKARAVRISDRQAAALKRQPDTPQGRRDALLMCLLLDHGLRVGELARLQVSEIDMQTGTMTFYRPKVDLIQTHQLSADTLRALRAWFDRGDAPAVGPLLRGSRKGGALTGAGMSERAITARVRALGEAVGLEGLSAHDCRHYWATYWADKVNPIQLKQAGGWSSMATVDRYVEESAIANQGMV